MNRYNFFLTFMISINAISCLAMQNDDDKQLKKTVSTLFKLTYKNEPAKAQPLKDFYQTVLNTFNQHTQELRNAIKLTETDHYEVNPTRSIRMTIITEDLIPLKYKIRN